VLRDAKRYSRHRIPIPELTIGFAKGGLMNSWPNEALAECHRRRIVEEVKKIHLERLALKSRLYRPRVFGRAMFRFGSWMISAGRQLCKHYEIPKPETVYE
jgi:hypothetical protein